MASDLSSVINNNLGSSCRKVIKARGLKKCVSLHSQHIQRGNIWLHTRERVDGKHLVASFYHFAFSSERYDPGDGVPNGHLKQVASTVAHWAHVVNEQEESQLRGIGASLHLRTMTTFNTVLNTDHSLK